MKTLRYWLSFSLIPTIILETLVFWFYCIQQDGLTLWYCHTMIWSMDVPAIILACFITSTAWSIYEAIKVLTAKE